MNRYKGLPGIKLRHFLFVAATFGSCASWNLSAQELEINVEIPRLQVAEYHRPYVAVWLEPQKGGEVTNLGVWYDTELADREGEKWLKDMRQWWRRSGRSLTMPVDGVSGATRPPGGHTVAVDPAKLQALDAGDYRLLVEAVREVGGRELLKIPFTWPPQQEQTLKQEGEHELGTVTLRFAPTSSAE